MVEEADTRGIRAMERDGKSASLPCSKNSSCSLQQSTRTPSPKSPAKNTEPSRSSKGAGKLPPKVRRLQEEWNTGVDSAMSAQVYNMSFFGGSQISENPDGLSLFYAVPAQIIGGSADMGAEELEMRLKTNNLPASQIQKLTSSKVQGQR